MKYLLTILFIQLFNIAAFSQTIRTGSFVANNPSVYPISGDVTVIEQNGNLTVVFESNFSTIQGLKLEVFLSKTGNLNTSTDLLISTVALDYGSPFMSPITGMRSYTPASGTDISEFDHVLVQCTIANILWGNVSLSAPQPAPPIARSGSFVANDPAVYPISGDVSVSEQAGVLTVIFESNFATIQGLRLEVFLSKSNMLDNSTDQLISLTPLDDGSQFMSPITGMRTFTAAPGTNIYDFDNVLVQCTMANLLWGHANLCESNLDIVNVVNSNSDYRAQDYITSSALVAAGSDIGYEASNFIELTDGFEVTHPADFNARVDSALGCTIE